MNLKTTIACLGATFVATSAAQADIIGSGGGFAIPDGDPGGISSSFAVVDDNDISSVTVNLQDLAHTWSGDLIMTLSHDNGDDVMSAVFVNRPDSDLTDGGATSFGSGIDYNGNYSFADSGSDLLSSLNGAVGTLGEGTYSHTALVTGTAPLSVFAGRSTAGTWTLSVSDNAAADTGSLGGWSLDATPVPAPGALALLGLAGLTAARRRRG